MVIGTKTTLKGYLALACLLLMSLTGFSQNTDTLLQKLDSLQKKTDSSGKQINNTDPSAFNENTVITLPGYFILLGSDLKQAFTAPFHLKKKDLKNVAKFILLETALSFADRPIQRNALDLRNSNKAVRDVSDYVTRFGGIYEVYTLLALGSYGFVFKDQKLKTTTLLATQAYITGGLVETALKLLAVRQRPNYIDPATGQPTSRFHGPFYKPGDGTGTRINSSFPSGHTTVAFAAATVFALEYKDKPWVPVLSYTAASLIGLSRITENKHWLTDIIAGAALGYLTGQKVVNNYHRYAQIRNAEARKKNTLVFNLNYSFGRVMPGVVYQFR